MARKYGLLINGQYVHTRSWRPIGSEGDENLQLGEMALFDSSQDDAGIYEAALEGVAQTFQQISRQDFFPLPERLAFFGRLRRRLEDQKENLAQLMTSEVGKPISLSRSEVDRAIATLDATLAVAEGVFRPRVLPTEGRKGWEPYAVRAVREARGPLLALSPFNFPVNLVMHKLAPAIAGGCPVLLKPSPKAALTALCLADYCQAEGLPPGMLNLFSCVDSDVVALIQDPRLTHISFTGSAAVGWRLKKLATKPFTLELGGAAPVFVGRDADLEKAALALANSAVTYAGQTCISTQSIHVEAPVLGKFLELIEARFKSLPWGSPAREEVVCGPVIDAASRARLEALKARLVRAGARVIETPLPPLDPERVASRLVRPALFLDLPATDAFYREECFGPFVALRPVENIDAFVEFANSLPQRLQTSIWGDPESEGILRASRHLDYGGVIVNDSPSVRYDPMPYGGRAEAGSGREGPLYALEEFTDWKSIVTKS